MPAFVRVLANPSLNLTAYGGKLARTLGLTSSFRIAASDAQHVPVNVRPQTLAAHASYALNVRTALGWHPAGAPVRDHLNGHSEPVGKLFGPAGLPNRLV
jgi:hypothetical protein